MTSEVSILISSCDKFSDCWKPYLHGFDKYWADCPYHVYIISNELEFEHPRVTFIKIGEDKTWGENTLKALKQIESPYILYTHEDFWLNEKVDNKAIQDYVSLMKEYDLYYLRLYPSPPPDKDFEYDSRLGVLADKAEYRTALQKAIWNRKILMELININENPWQFEVEGNTRSYKYKDKFLCVKPFYKDKKRFFHGINYVCTAINKGKWSKAAVVYAEAEGLNIDFSTRPHETWWHDFVRMNKATIRVGWLVDNLTLLFTDFNKFKQKVKKKI